MDLEIDPEINLTGNDIADAYEDIRVRLEAIAEDLADVALARIRDQFGEDPAGAKDEEKRVSRARRAVLKAARELEG